jgi:alpha-beta hydrolase superfamily lysophospholipase
VLAGTLLLPLGVGPHPAVMLCHHANTHQRDYYRLFAEPLVAQGIAAFIYDKRGSGESTGTALFSEIGALADDATVVFRFLQQHPALRGERIGIWGISNGAGVGALAAERTGAALVIGAAVAGVPPWRLEQIRRAHVAAALGASPRAVALITRLWGALFPFMIDGQWTAEVETVLQEVAADEELQRLPKHPDHGPGLQPVPPTVPIAEIREEWGGNWADGAFDIAAVYGRLGCPIRCVWGADDAVVPVEEGQARIAAALAGRPPGAYEAQVIPGATHQLYVAAPAVEGMLPEVMHTYLHQVTVAPGVRALMAEWAAGLRE